MNATSKPCRTPLISHPSFRERSNPQSRRAVRVLLFPCCLLYVLVSSQAVARKQAQVPPDHPLPRSLHNLVISADGTWLAAEEHSDRGKANVRVWSTRRRVTFTIERGRSPRISRDSRWVSALQDPPTEDAGAGVPMRVRKGRTLVLLDTRDGSQKTFDNVLSYEMTCASTYLLYLESPQARGDEGESSKDKATKPDAPQRERGTFHQVPLNPERLAQILRPYQPDQTFSKEHVSTFAAHPTNDHFAYVYHDEQTGGDTLHIVKWGVRAWFHGERIEGLCWAGGADGGDDSIRLGFIDTRSTTDTDGKRRLNSALYTWHPGQSPAETFTRVDPAR